MILNFMVINNKKIFLLIFFGFLLSVFQNNYNLKNYDKNILDVDGEYYHQMIKADARRYLSHGNEIKEQLKSGINFFETGREHFTKYLPARIAALYYYLTNNDLFETPAKKKINLDIHFGYLFFQSLFYFLSITILYLSANKTFNDKICFYLILFLCFEPTINQYHSSFWSESYLITIIVLLTSLVIKPNIGKISFFLIGVFLGLLTLQKEYAIFYIIPITLYFSFFYNYKNYRNILLIFFGFFIILSILGLNNFKRSGSFYILTATTKSSLLTHLVNPVISKKYNLKSNEFLEKYESEAAKNWIEDNSIDYDKKKFDEANKKGPRIYRETITNEKDIVKFDDFFFKRTFKYIFENPIDFAMHITKKSIHITLLNPFHIYSDNKFKSGEIYYTSEKHDQLVPYRIFYTFVIYLICCIGLIVIIKEKNYKLLFFIISSLFFFFAPISWIGNTRNFVPCLIFIAFLFSFGLTKILEIKKKY